MDLSRISVPGTSRDVLPDGSFVLVQPAVWEIEGRTIEIVVHWDGRLRRRGPAP